MDLGPLLVDVVCLNFVWCEKLPFELRYKRLVRSVVATYALKPSTPDAGVTIRSLLNSFDVYSGKSVINTRHSKMSFHISVQIFKSFISIAYCSMANISYTFLR